MGAETQITGQNLIEKFIGLAAGNRVSNRWLILSSLGLGFCIAASKVDRYTMLWNVGHINLLEDFLIVVLLVVGTLSLIGISKKHVIYRSLPLLIVLNLLQITYFVIKILWVYGNIPDWLVSSSTLLTQFSIFMFLVYANFFLKSGIKKSVIALALGLIVAGILQMTIALLPQLFSIFLAFFFLPISTVLLLVADKLRTPDLIQKEREDRDIETENGVKSFSKKEFVGYCLDLFLLNTLGITLLCLGMTLQDGGVISMNIQVVSGIGTLLGGALFIVALRYLHEVEVLELLRTLILPLIIASLYLSDYFGKSLVSVYFMPLGICYAVLLLFVWVVPRQMSDESRRFSYTCITHLCFMLGWAMGILSTTILPGLVPGFSSVFVIIGCFVGIFILYILNIIHTLKQNRERKNASLDTSDSEAMFLNACNQVAQRYNLSARENEVLILLAKGRNAHYIASTLIISEGTARTHIMHIYRKMDIKSQQVLMDKVEQALTEDVISE